MIGYVTLGTNDLARARAFYDALLGEVGIKRIMEFDERGTAWGMTMGQPALGIMTPYDKRTATAGNGTMVAIVVDSKDKVDRLYAKAMALGSKDEGGPGPRGEGFYAAYFRDLDGNKLNAFFVG